MAYLLAGAKVTTFKRVTFQLRDSTLHKKLTQISDLAFHQSVHRLRRVDSGQKHTDNTEMHRLVFSRILTRAKFGFTHACGADLKGFCEQARLVDMANYQSTNLLFYQSTNLLIY